MSMIEGDAQQFLYWQKHVSNIILMTMYDEVQSGRVEPTLSIECTQSQLCFDYANFLGIPLSEYQKLWRFFARSPRRGPTHFWRC